MVGELTEKQFASFSLAVVESFRICRERTKLADRKVANSRRSRDYQRMGNHARRWASDG